MTVLAKLMRIYEGLQLVFRCNRSKVFYIPLDAQGEKATGRAHVHETRGSSSHHDKGFNRYLLIVEMMVSFMVGTRMKRTAPRIDSKRDPENVRILSATRTGGNRCGELTELVELLENIKD